MVELPVGAAAVVDDGERVPRLVLAAEVAGVVRQLPDEPGGVVLDVHPAAGAPDVAEEGEHAVALGEPAVLGDDLGGRIRRQQTPAVQLQQPPHERGVERDDAQRVVEPGTGVADPHLHRRIVLRRPDVPPQFAAVLDELHPPVGRHDAFVVRPGQERARHAGTRQRAHDAQPAGLEPGLAAVVEGRRRRQRMQQRQVAPDGGHHPDAGIGIAEAGVDVHAPDDQPAHALLEGVGEPLVTLAGRDELRLPRAERVAGRGHHRRPVPRRRLHDQPAGLAQRRARLGHRSAHLRGGLDLGAERFVHDRVRPALPLALLEDARVGVGQQIARLRVDEEELLLDAERDGEIRFAHGPGLRFATDVPVHSATMAIPHGRSPAGTLATTCIVSVSTTLTSFDGPFAV